MTNLCKEKLDYNTKMFGFHPGKIVNVHENCIHDYSKSSEGNFLSR